MVTDSRGYLRRLTPEFPFPLSQPVPSAAICSVLIIIVLLANSVFESRLSLTFHVA
jgi:hypothetical protein